MCYVYMETVHVKGVAILFNTAGTLAMSTMTSHLKSGGLGLLLRGHTPLLSLCACTQ